MSNDRPDYVTENWLRCLGLSGNAAKAVMDVHTDQLNAVRDENAKLREEIAAARQSLDPDDELSSLSVTEIAALRSIKS